MPHRWLFIKQASRLGSLSLKSHVQVPDADIPQAAFRLTGQELLDMIRRAIEEGEAK